jgi:hypothetical protein
MVGATEWQSESHGAKDVHSLMDDLRQNLSRLGYTGRRVREIPIRNSKGGILYHLVFATKKPLGDDIWSSIVRTDAHRQRSLF